MELMKTNKMVPLDKEVVTEVRAAQEGCWWESALLRLSTGNNSRV